MAYPIQFMNTLHLLIPARRDEMKEKIESKPFLHIWNEVLRRAVIFPWMAPPSGSLMAELFARHGIDFGQSPVYSAEQIQRLHDNYYANATWAHPVAEKAEKIRLETQLKSAESRVNDLAAEVEQLRIQIFALQSGKGCKP